MVGLPLVRGRGECLPPRRGDRGRNLLRPVSISGPSRCGRPLPSGLIVSSQSVRHGAGGEWPDTGRTVGPLQSQHVFAGRAQYGDKMPPLATAIKCEMLFQAGDQESGWSEVYYLGQATIQQAESALDLMWTVRSTFLSPDNSLLGYRITQPLLPPGPGFLRSQRAAFFTERNAFGSAKAGTGASAQSLIGVMCRLNDATLSIFKNQVYRGCPVGYWSASNDKVARADFANWGPKWQQVLRQVNAAIRHATRAVPPFNFQPIVNVEYRRMDYRKAGRSFETLRGRR